MKKLFIINKKAGTRSKKELTTLLEEFCRISENHASLAFTSYPGHAAEITSKAITKDVEMVIAVGGDGTVNEVAGKLINSTCTLGIVPTGSGNGLARHFKIPMDPVKALGVLKNGKKILIDTMQVNDRVSVNISGAGFDAHVAGLFAKNGKRGFSSYATLTLREFFQYQPVSSSLILDGKSYPCKPFILAFANGSQWGNNAWIAPMADPADGMITVCMLEKQTLLSLPGFAFRLFTGKLKNSYHLNYYQAREVALQAESILSLHIDGEPAGDVRQVIARLIPASLWIRVPSTK